MPIDKSHELNSILVSLLIGLGTLFIGTITVLYNLIWKSIRDLWKAKNENEKETQKNAVDIAGINARCEERVYKKK